MCVLERNKILYEPKTILALEVILWSRVVT